MSEDMIKDGYTEIMNIDISAIVIEMMKRKYAVVRQLKCNTLTFSPRQPSNFILDFLPCQWGTILVDYI